MHRARPGRPYPPRPWDDAYAKQGQLWRGSGALTPEIQGMVDAAEGGLIVEVGCGDGKHLAALASRHPGRLVGLDVSLKALHLARRRPGVRGDLLQADACRGPLSDGCAAGVAMVHVVDHLSLAGRRAALGQAWRLLRPHGRLVVIMFGAGDLRQGRGLLVEERTWRKGNGIAYHYFVEGEVATLLGAEPESARREERTVRFASMPRVRLHQVFRKATE